MSEFYDAIDEILGEADDISDITATVRKCWFYDFRDDPVYLWDGQGAFTDNLGREWLGTIDANGVNHHRAPPLQDGRDGSSASYTFTFNIPDRAGEDPLTLYNALKEEQDKVAGRALICYLALFKEGEGLRPGTPLSFYKDLVMFSPKFSEEIQRGADNRVVKSYSASIVARDSNSGRSATPNRTYADTMQKRRANELGVAVDRGAEYLALLANRTYQIP